MLRSVKNSVLSLVLAAPVVAVLGASSGTSAAASCAGMTLGYSVSGGGLVVLTPDHVDVAYRGCVVFTNRTAATASIRVGGHYSQQVAPNSSTSGSRNFTGTTSGRLSVTATSGPATAHGSVTVGSAPSRSASPNPTRTRTATPSLAPTPTQSSVSGTGPQVAPTPKQRRHEQSPSLAPGGVIEPPVSPPGPIQLTPSATPSEGPAIASGPVEPPSGRGIGLPAAIAAVTVVGTGAALVRVIAAEPVDSPKIVGGPS
jgi:hypothetical protein